MFIFVETRIEKGVSCKLWYRANTFTHVSLWKGWCVELHKGLLFRCVLALLSVGPAAACDWSPSPRGAHDNNFYFESISYAVISEPGPGIRVSLSAKAIACSFIVLILRLRIFIKNSSTKSSFRGYVYNFTGVQCLSWRPGILYLSRDRVMSRFLHSNSLAVARPAI
jgi:hypothetical protein